ncbi:MAG: AMP-binding protein [Acidimicrobiales bacterium]
MIDETLHSTGREITAIATRDPGRTAIITNSGERLTFGRLEHDVDAIASAFVTAGLEPGDVVALLCRNRPEWMITYEAALRAGVTLLPVNWHLEVEDVQYVLFDSGAKALVAESYFESQTANLPDSLLLCVSIGGQMEGFGDWSEIIAAHSDPCPERPRGTQMIYTSGTTGRPKGVRHAPQPSAAAAAAGTAMVAMFGMNGDDGDSMLCTAPLYHSGPSRLCLEWPLGAGVTVVLMDRFEPRRALELLDHYSITHAFFVPTMFNRMLTVPDRSEFDVSYLRFVLHGAGPCTIATKQAMFDWFGPIIHEIYAASEGPGTWITPQEWLAHPGSVGRVDPERIRIRRDDRSDADANELGTIWFFSASQFRYHGDAEKTATTYDESGQWYTVDDRGHVDAEGYLFLSGRTAECINCGGVNIYPARIDEALASSPGIIDGAAFGLPDDDLGEVVAAAIVIEESADAEQLIASTLAHCRELVGSQLTPKHVFIVNELPRSDAGKLYRSRLVQQFKDR